MIAAVSHQVAQGAREWSDLMAWINASFWRQVLFFGAVFGVARGYLGLGRTKR